ncbi:GumC family protein [Zobellia uliginosa]|uniref:GumC family protein n=1 Tax=Zobellia uliginosa TaxID=143224 RepID=UPI001C07E5E3|nr:polysaccharide biosynthesis tyrosine autokinase [Zobellia uliginosa]MBU2947823.1 polysaccharide biosynthesis tyrosine autokinase [Zobellia uliginosa]
MKEASYMLEPNDDEDSFLIKEIFLKYLKYWKWFLVMAIVGLFFGFIYLRYTTKIYASVAKIRIIDDSAQTDIASEAVSNMWGLSSINLDNEIEVLKSYRITSQVVSELQLDVNYFYKGTIKTNEIWDAPFKIKKHISEDSIISPLIYDIELEKDGFVIKNIVGEVFTAPLNLQNTLVSGLPFSIQLLDNIDVKEFENISYKVMLFPKKAVAMQLSNMLRIEPIKKKGDIIAIWLNGENAKQSEVIINTLIEKYNQDVILDRQLVSKRTLDFIDERFLYLTTELDSIEIGKQNYKQQNDLSYIENDATSALSAKSNIEEELFDLETQISLSNLLKKTVKKEDQYSLLPADVGLENSSLNALVSDYNDKSLKRAKLLNSVGESHPSLQLLNGQLERGKGNILKTVDVYQKQLRTSLYQLNQEKNRAGNKYSTLPEKEKVLRSIERQQSIKENLFLLLLQKREEAAINHAVTSSSLKIVDYALTGNGAIFPKTSLVYPFSILLGVLIPFIFLFIKFFLDDKIYNRLEITKLNSKTPILGEIPFFTETENLLSSRNRSILAESFRLLCANVNYYSANKTKEKSQIIYVTSAVKGEGKTLVAMNLAIAYSNLNKKVLLVGGDLRNPQLHRYFKNTNKALGLSDYLNGTVTDWEGNLINVEKNNSLFKVCLAGTIVSNPTELLSSVRFEQFISSAKNEFDYVIVDTAPSILVSDTALISKYADMTLFVVRAGFTNKKLIEYSKDLFDTGRLNQMCYVLNSAGLGDKNNYNYGYEYGYGYDQGPVKNGFNKSFENLMIIGRSTVDYIKIKVSEILSKILKRRD